MPATLSIEGQIENRMRELEISARNLCEIARLLHVPINTSKLSIALSDKKRLDGTAGDKLLGLLEELKTARNRFPDVPIDWSRWERISTLVVLLRVEQAAAELGQDKINSYTAVVDNFRNRALGQSLSCGQTREIEDGVEA